MTRKVVCSACKYGPLILCGARHFDKVMHSQLDALRKQQRPKAGSQWDQGFIDQFGVFMDRKEAMQVAMAAGQEIDIKRGCGGDSETLYSEGLY